MLYQLSYTRMVGFYRDVPSGARLGWLAEEGLRGSYHSCGTSFSSAVASVSGTDTTLSPCSAAIWPQLPACTRSAAFRPKRRPRMRSRGVGDAAALDVAEHRRARLHAGARLDLLGHGVADGAVLDPDVAELVDLALVGDAGQLGALAGDDHREVLAARLAALDRGGDVVVDDRLLGDEDVVGAAGDAGEERDPAGVAAHRLDDDDPVVRLGGRVAAVDRVGRDRDGRVEAEGVVGAVRSLSIVFGTPTTGRPCSA